MAPRGSGQMTKISVKAHGAIGDGIADDTQAFIDAQAAAVFFQVNDVVSQTPSNGGLVVYVPPGFYRADIVADGRVSFIGERNQSVIMAATDGQFALTYPLPPPHRVTRWQRPFVQGLSFQGTVSDAASRSRGGVRIENWYGVDLIDVNIWRCSIGLESLDNYYGTWDRLFITECDVGLHLTSNINNNHTGNKRLINPQLRLNGTAMLIDANISRLALYGGTIEGNRTGVVINVSSNEEWKDNGALFLRDVWFEDNLNHPEFGGEITLGDGTVVPTGDIFVNNGTAVFENTGASHVWIKSQGKLYAYFGAVGRGPSDSFLDIETGGFFMHENSVVPAGY